MSYADRVHHDSDHRAMIALMKAMMREPKVSRAAEKKAEEASTKPPETQPMPPPAAQVRELKDGELYGQKRPIPLWGKNDLRA